MKKEKNKMGNFDYKKWVIENKYGKLNEDISFSDIEKNIYEVPQAGYEGMSSNLEKFKGKFIAPGGGGSTLGKIEVIQVQEYEKKPNGVFRPIGSTISLKFGGYDLNNLKVVGKVPGKN